MHRIELYSALLDSRRVALRSDCYDNEGFEEHILAKIDPDRTVTEQTVKAPKTPATKNVSKKGASSTKKTPAAPKKPAKVVSQGQVKKTRRKRTPPPTDTDQHNQIPEEDKQTEPSEKEEEPSTKEKGTKPSSKEEDMKPSKDQELKDLRTDIVEAYNTLINSTAAGGYEASVGYGQLYANYPTFKLLLQECLDLLTHYDHVFHTGEHLVFLDK